MSEPIFRVGQKVDYHSVIGGPVTSKNHKVLYIAEDFAEDFHYKISGKSGAVAEEALSLSAFRADESAAEKLLPAVPIDYTPTDAAILIARQAAEIARLQNLCRMIKEELKRTVKARGLEVERVCGHAKND